MKPSAPLPVPRPEPPTYRLYIDESGDHTYGKLDRPGHCHLGLLGVWFHQKDDYPPFVEGVKKLTSDCFGATLDEPVDQHRKDIIGFKGPFGVLRDPKVMTKFNDALLRLVSESKFTMVCVVI